MLQHFRLQIIIKWLRIAKSSEKKNSRGVKYLSKDQQFWRYMQLKLGDQFYQSNRYHDKELIKLDKKYGEQESEIIKQWINYLPGNNLSFSVSFYFINFFTWMFNIENI